VLSRPQLIFRSKTWFFGIYLNFQWQKSLKNQYLSHSESKSYQINSIKSSHQDIFNNIKGTFQFLRNFLLWYNLFFNEEVIQYSRTFAPQVQTPWNQADAPLLLESFPKRPRARSEASWFRGSHKYKQNNTNKLSSFIDRCFSKPWVLKFETILPHAESLVKLKRVISKPLMCVKTTWLNFPVTLIVHA
jgi:hypothetical protein